MLRYDLIHPPLIEALAASGHGSQILLADGNFPALTVRPPSARLVYFNLAPGILTVPEVLRVLLTAVNVESATMMQPPGGEEPEAQRDYASLLGPAVPIERVDRLKYYDLVRSADVGLIVTTADERTYANLLLTVGLR